MNLAIKGHTTRGKEVIEILEMLGGKNIHNYNGTFNECYVIDNDKICTIYTSVAQIDGFVIFTLEEFLEKFPYKVGDKVQHRGATSCGSVYEVEKMRWVDDHVEYEVKRLWCWNDHYTFTAEDLQPYIEETMDKAVFDVNAQCCDIMNRLIKKETMEEQKKDYEEWFQINYLEFENNDDTWADEVEVNLGKDYEIQIRGDKTLIVKKHPQYPKTYEECCEVLFPNSIAMGKVLTSGYNCEKLKKFGELLICRDAYWKIAGKQMKLGKPWEPDWSNDLSKYYISFYNNKVDKGVINYSNKILAFPTEEMRDTFFDNFKELIEQCKELI